MTQFGIPWLVAALLMPATAMALDKTPGQPVADHAVAQQPASIPSATYAQFLADKTIRKYPALATLALHIGQPDGSATAISASRPGTATSADRFAKLHVLQDVAGDPIGTVEMQFAYRTGDDKAVITTMAKAIAGELRKKILSVQNLMDPFPYAPGFPIHTYAQQLVDQTLEMHPNVLVIALHVASPLGRNYPIIASNIGRIGKAADDDDLRVIHTGESHFEVSASGKRFEVEMVLQDAAMHSIGAVAVVLPYHAGADKSALKKTAQAIREELRTRIPSVEQLVAEVN